VHSKRGKDWDGDKTLSLFLVFPSYIMGWCSKIPTPWPGTSEPSNLCWNKFHSLQTTQFVPCCYSSTKHIFLKTLLGQTMGAMQLMCNVSLIGIVTMNAPI
jgi:hypothetical protein